MTLWWLPLLPAALAPLLWVGGRGASRGALAVGAGGVLFATLAIAACGVAFGWTGTYGLGVEGGAGEPLVLRAALDPLAALVALTVPAVALPVAVYAAAHEARAGLARLLALLVWFVAAMELVVVAADLLTLLVGWEAVSACSWALIAHHWRDGERPRAATRAFVAVRAGDLGLFVAAAALFAGTGRFDYDALAALPSDALALVAAGVVVAAAAKSAQLPFAPWLFAAMAGPTSVSALLHAATLVAAGGYLLARLEPALAPVPWLGPVVLGIGLATALAAGTVAALQAHAKKLLAASTSAHQGLVWIAIGAGLPAVAVLHLVAHAFFKALLFLVAGLAEAARGSWMLHRLRAGRALPFAAAVSAVGALALAGVPPLGGAWTKEAVVTAAGRHAPWAALLVALAGGISAFYAMRFQLLAFGRSDDEAPPQHPPSRAERFAVGALAVASLALGAVWVPGARDAIAAALGSGGAAAEIPASKTWELAASLGFVAFFLLAARVAVARVPRLGAEGASAAAADWLGLPTLARRALVQPGGALARHAASLDDRALAALPRGVALARHAAHFDDRVLAALPRGAAKAAAVALLFLCRADGRIDAAVRATAGACAALARAGRRTAEAAFAGLVQGLARVLDLAGADLRRAQTGRSHHYYAAVATGVAVFALLLAASANAVSRC